MRSFLSELRLAFRRLSRAPGFTAACVFTLALAIGVNTAVFTLVDSLLIAPLPYPDASKIVAIDTHFDRNNRTIARSVGADIAALEQQATDIAALAYFSGGDMGVQTHDHASFTSVTFANSRFASVFSLTPVAGRLLNDSDAGHAAVVSERWAQQNFGSSAAAVGQTISIEATSYNIVGVLPARYDYPRATRIWIAEPDVPRDLSHDAFNYNSVVARLSPDASVASAQAQLNTIAARLAGEFDANHGRGFVVVPLQQQLTGSVRPVLLLLLGAVGLILLIACVNVAHLQLARATTKFRELAIRSALGGTRWQIARSVAAEGLAVVLMGGVLGTLIAWPIVRILIKFAPVGTPRLDEVQINLWVLLFTFVLCAFAVLLTSLAPAWHAWRVNITDALKNDSSRGLAGRDISRFRSMLVAGEIALTFLLAIAAGLLGRTLLKLSDVNPGFDSSSVLVMYVHAPANTDQDYLRRTQQLDELNAKLAAVPGVQKVSSVMGLPAGQYGSNGSYAVGGQAELQNRTSAIFTLSSPGYFDTMGVQLLKGRDFTLHDRSDAEPVAVISESLARDAFPAQDPIGKQIRCGLDRFSFEHWMTIVGVVADVRQDSPASSPAPALYMPLAQHPSRANEVQVVMRTSVAPVSIIDSARRTVEEMDPSIATKFTTMEVMLQESVAAQRFRATLIGSFAAIGLLLAVIGVYGVMAYVVSQRTYEVGVRLTFGAEPGDILQMVLRQALSMAALGVIAGLVIAVFAARFLASMVFGVSAHDPVTFTAAVLLLPAAAAAAAFIPARHAARVDPMQALRSE